MITRKAILAAFEVITNDNTIKTVTYFVDTTAQFNRMERVRVTRISKGRTGQDFRVQFGRCNYAERKYVKKFARRGERIPKLWIVLKKRKKTK